MSCFSFLLPSVVHPTVPFSLWMSCGHLKYARSQCPVFNKVLLFILFSLQFSTPVYFCSELPLLIFLPGYNPFIWFLTGTPAFCLHYLHFKNSYHVLLETVVSFLTGDWKHCLNKYSWPVLFVICVILLSISPIWREKFLDFWICLLHVSDFIKPFQLLSFPPPF